MSEAALPDANDSGGDQQSTPDSLGSAFTSALPERGKSVGHTSVVFKLSLDSGQSVAYKPRSHVGGERFRGEIAAYRLAAAWRLNNVIPAIPRSFPADVLRGSLDEKATALFSKEVITESDGTVRGALIPWIPNLDFLPLETAKERARWGAWLDPNDAGSLSGCDADLASQISTMILFDTMTGNWDRWSGGNVGVVRTTGACDHVMFIDNDGAFFDPVPAASAASQLALVKKILHFSRGFVTNLKSTTEGDLQSALGEESAGKPLLPSRIVDAFFARRKTVIAAVDASIAAHGEAATLSLP